MNNNGELVGGRHCRRSLMIRTDGSGPFPDYSAHDEIYRTVNQGKLFIP